MKLNEYQERAATTAIYQRNAMEYLVLGLASEAGEVAGILKKYLRDGETQDITGSLMVKMVRELGDVLWYLAMIAAELGISLQTVAELNLEKLSDRKARGVIGGTGDNR